jgi:hypothetical protein
MPSVRKIIMAIMAPPKNSIRALAIPLNTSGRPTINKAPNITPGMLADPPNKIRVNMSTDSQKLNDSGEMMVIFEAKISPTIPAQAAPMTKQASL